MKQHEKLKLAVRVMKRDEEEESKKEGKEKVHVLMKKIGKKEILSQNRSIRYKQTSILQ